MSSVRTQIIRLASAHPEHSAEQRQALTLLRASVEKQSDSNTTPKIDALMEDLKKVPGVKTVYVADTWPRDYWYHIRVVLVNSKTSFSIRARAPEQTFFVIPDLGAARRGILAAVKKSKLQLDETICFPEKKYEFLDSFTKMYGGMKPRSGYDENEVSIQVYDVP